MSPSLDYDAEAADLVARTLRAVAADTDVADRDEAAVPIASMPAPVELGARRSRRLPRTLVATAAAAAVLVAALVWAGRDPSAPSGTPDLGTATDSTLQDGAATPGTDLTPAEIVPGYTAGLAAMPDPLTSTGVLHLAQAFLMEPPSGGEILSVVVTWPDGYVPNDGEVGRVATALAMMTGTEATTRSTAVPGEIAGHVTLPIGDVDPALVETVHQVLVEEGVGVQRFARDSGWGVQDVDVSWVPGVAPTVGRRYGAGEASLDVYTAFGDIAGAKDMTRVLDGATPYPVGGSMGWRATAASGDSLFVWQAAPGTVVAVIAGEAVAAEVPAIIESIGAPAPAVGDHPNVRPVGRSEEGSDVPWVLEVADFLPGMDERPCLSLWTGGQVAGPTCGLTVPGPPAEGPFLSFGPLTHIGDDVTVVFALVGPTVAALSTEAPGAEQALVESQPVDPSDPAGPRYAVMIVHGDREAPQTFRLLDADGQVLHEAVFDLNDVGG
jgi:hypothetical protein